LIKAREGDVVTLHAPGGTEELEIVEVKYRTIPMEPFGEKGQSEADRGNASS
jgi:transcription elongation factor GreB